MPKEPKFFIGIDIGHGETSATRIPGYHGEAFSYIPLKKDKKKIISAICSNNGDKWQLISSSSDYTKPYVRCQFKGMINKLKPDDREALREFGKLIFNRILKEDNELEYDPVTGEANFVICIACPTQWRKDDSSAPDEYLNFFRNEAGILPAKMCINESDAAFFTHYDKDSAGKNILIIDLGSSTADFTVYHNGKVLPYICKSTNDGASEIENILVSEVIYKNEDAKKQIRKAALMRHSSESDPKYKDPKFYENAENTKNEEKAVELCVREAKENFFSGIPTLPKNYDPKRRFPEDYYAERDSRTFKLNILMASLVPLSACGKSAREDIIRLVFSYKNFIEIIQTYRDKLNDTLKNNAHLIHEQGIEKLDKVILSGGASSMNIFQEDVWSAYDGAQTPIDNDNASAWVVSLGAAKYIQAHYNALNKMLEELEKVDYGKLLVDSDIEAIREATRQLIPPVLEKLTGYYNYNGEQFVEAVAEFIKKLDPDNPRYRELFQRTARQNLQRKVGSAVSKAIMEVFNIDIDLSDIKLNIEFPMAPWKNGTFDCGQKGYRKVRDIVKEAGTTMLIHTSRLPPVRFNFNYSRNKEQREFMAREIFSTLTTNPLDIKWPEEYLKTLTAELKGMVLELARLIFNEKGLFQASVSASSPAKNK